MLSERNFETLLYNISAESGNLLNGVRRQLSPFSWMSHLCHGKLWDINAHYVLDGIFNEFHVIDPVLPDISYHQRNYWSCYAGEVEEEL